MIGDNGPPSAIEDCQIAVVDLNQWLESHPVILSGEDAKAGKLLVDRASLIIADAEAERDKQVRPLNEQVKHINERYRTPRETLRQVADLLAGRLADFIRAERERREAEAEEKRQAALEAEAKARAAEEKEQEAKDNAKLGELVDVGSAVAVADSAFRAYEAAVRQAARAEKDAEHVKIPGGFRRAMSIPKKEILTLDNWRRAIDEMGLSEALIKTILQEARAYRKRVGYLPNGITAIMKETR